MAIYKAKVSSHFVTIPNQTAQDTSLSFEARGVLTMLLSKPEDWAVSKEWLIQQSPNCGRDKMARILNELVKHGYMSKTQPKNQQGKFSKNDYFVYPSPVDVKTVDGLSVDGESHTTKERVIQKKEVTKNNNVDSHQRTCERAFIDELQDKQNCTIAMQVLKDLSSNYSNTYTGSQTQEQWNACEDALIELWDGFCGDYGSLHKLMTDVAVGMLEKRFSKRKSVGLPAMLMVNSGDDLVTVLEKSDILEL